MSPGRRIVAAWLPALAYMALIWALSSMRIEVPVVNEVPLRDKGVHFLEYAVLGLLLAHAVVRTWPARSRWRLAAVGALMAAGWGLLDELHQALVPGRDADPLDWAADALGACAGASLRLGFGWLATLFRREPRREAPAEARND